jgi:hypothetical protein
MTPPVELHIVSDATGETATRLVAALEAQFPEQPFEEIRHPRVETVDDLRLVVDRAKGRPAVVVYTIVKPELRGAMRDFCRRAKLHYCDILGPPLASIAKLVIAESRAFPEIGRFYLKEVIGRGVPLFEGLIRRGIAQGEFREVDPVLTVRSLVGAMLLAGVWKTVFEPIGAEKLDVRALARHHADLMLHALMPRPSGPVP